MPEQANSIEKNLQELTALREENAALKRDLDQNEKMIGQLTEGIVFSDAKNKITYMNQAAIELYGWTFEELEGKDPAMFNVDPAREQIQKDIKAIISSGHSYYGDLLNKRKDGSEFQCQLKISPILSSDEEILGYVQVVRDVTGQDTLIKEIIKSQKKYFAIMNQANDAIFIADMETGILIDANQKAQSLIGRTLNEIMKMHQSELYPKHLRVAYKEIYENNTTNENLEEDFIYVLHKDGSHIPAKINTSVIEVDGKLLIQGIFRDISTQLARKNTLDLQRTALNAAANGIMITNAKREIVWINPAFSHLTGYTFEETIGQTPNMLNSGIHPPEMFQKLWAAIFSGEVWSGQIINKRKNGSLYIDEQTITPVRNEDEEISHYIAIKQDVSERIKGENDLKRKLKEANILQRIATAGATLQDEDELISVVTQMIHKKLYSDHVGVMLIDEETNMLYPHPSQIGIKPDDYKVRIPLGKGVTGKVAKTGKAILVKDIKKIKYYIPAIDGLQSELCVPLIVGGKIIGVINIESKTIGAFTKEDEQVLLTISSLLATAIGRIRLYLQVLHSNMALSMAYDKTLEGWAKALELRDHETQGHSERVTDLTIKLARHMGVDEDEIIHIQRGALLHDIGKIGIPDSILFKTSTLNEEEWEIMRQHPLYAYNILDNIPFLIYSTDIPYYHHERWDGKGYPEGIKGAKIPLAARIFTIVDAWDALITSRPYRASWSRKQTLIHLKKESGKQFDPKVVKAFLEMIETER